MKIHLEAGMGLLHSQVVGEDGGCHPCLALVQPEASCDEPRGCGVHNPPRAWSAEGVLLKTGLRRAVNLAWQSQ